MKGLSPFLLVCLGSSVLGEPGTSLLGYQDSLGQYSFGYSAPGSARSEVRTANGETRGSYSYIDSTGNIQSAEYVANGEHGFRVVATNLPKAPLPVQETPEVAAARMAHLQAFKAYSDRLKQENAGVAQGHRDEAAQRAENVAPSKIDSSERKVQTRIAEKVEGQTGRTPETDASSEEEKQGSGIKQENVQTLHAKSKDIDPAIQEEGDNISNASRQDQKLLTKAAEGAVQSFEGYPISVLPLVSLPNVYSYSYLSQPYFTNLQQPAVPIFRILPAKEETQQLITFPRLIVAPGSSESASESTGPEKNEETARRRRAP